MTTIREAFPEPDGSTRFYEFRQNNSGGSFDYDVQAGISVHVIVEATSAADANRRAEVIGLYFDGYGDCDCCGPRWYEQRGGVSGDHEPSIYGTPISTYDFRGSIKWVDGYEAFVHYLNGRIEGYGKGR